MRPQSGITMKDAPDNNQENKSEMPTTTASKLFGTENVDEDDKFNKMMVLEISDQRRNIKISKDEFFKKKAAEEEK